MYDVNPLGPLMHLKELERRAAPTLQSASAKDRPGILGTGQLWAIAVLKRFGASPHSATRKISAN